MSVELTDESEDQHADVCLLITRSDLMLSDSTACCDNYVTQ